MSKQLDELLFTIRQHAAFQELLDGVELPPLKNYRTGEDPERQYAEFIHRSGRRLQHASWRQFLIGEPTPQEKPK